MILLILFAIMIALAPVKAASDTVRAKLIEIKTFAPDIVVDIGYHKQQAELSLSHRQKDNREKHG